MALWQYTFLVLPKESTNEIVPDLVFSKDGELFDDSSYWKYAEIKPEIFKPINDILPLGKSWSKDLVLYGDSESNCFEVFLNGEFIESVSFRIDFKTNYETILDKLLHFLMQNDMIVLDEDLKVMRLNEYDFKTTIEYSEQYVKYSKMSEALSKRKDSKK